MRKMLTHISNEVKAGNPLSSSLRKHPEAIDDLYCEFSGTGEAIRSTRNHFMIVLAIYKEKAEA